MRLNNDQATANREENSRDQLIIVHYPLLIASASSIADF
jgi:hypothetical protein